MSETNNDNERLSQAEGAPESALERASAEDKIFVASQWQLIWWRFRKHKVALFSAAVLILLYLTIILAEFVSPYDPRGNNAKFVFAPPQKLHFFGPDGKLYFPPFVYGYTGKMNMETLQLRYEENRSVLYPLAFFVRGQPYKLWGLFASDIHLFGVSEGGTLFLLGTDRQGRDMLSRLIAGGRMSLSIGMVGLALSFFLGILLGGLSGYYGGIFDLVTQRIIEFLRSVPTIPLWMALSAALPPRWSVTQVYFGIVVILSLLGWTGLARVVRSKFMSLREEDFIMSARLVGASEMRIVFRHMVPSFTSHLIASLSMSIPGMILGETTLSFIGLGLQEPAISWGVLLKDAQAVAVLAESPWLLIPGIPVVIVVLAFNFLGDGIRDAADPYSR